MKLSLPENKTDYKALLKVTVIRHERSGTFRLSYCMVSGHGNHRQPERQFVGTGNGSGYRRTAFRYWYTYR
ncbi:hypothetical protein [Bacteroides cellulosilyticus]|uniref:hypothetical protein n=1 Tax=Bacteroides cellulosilyticus TaxID=246787 RepID=UPI002F96C0BF